MTKFVDTTLESNFALCTSLSANGIFASGASLSTGISGRIWIESGVARLHLKETDALTNAGRRSEIQFGVFPTGAGEYWSTFEFKYNWDHLGTFVLGSWYASPDSGDGLKYVPVGFRIRSGCLVIQVPDNLPTEGIGSRVIAAVPIEKNRWYKVTCHADLQSTATGMREVLLDGVPIVREYSIATNYVDVSGPYLKLGPYNGFFETGYTSLDMWLRNVTMWSGNDGYQTVMGRVPIRPDRVLQL